MVAMATLTGVRHPIQQLDSLLFPDDCGRIDLVSGENIEKAKALVQERIQDLQTKLILLDVLGKALKAITTGENSVLVSLLNEKDYAGLDAWNVDYEEKGLDAANLTGVVKVVFKILMCCELKPCIKPWCSGDEPSNFALYISW